MFAPPDKEKLGARFTCFECGTKFYDLNKPEPLCPECGADQNNAPKMDFKAILGTNKARRPLIEDDEPAKPKVTESEDEDDDLADDAEDEEDEE